MQNTLLCICNRSSLWRSQSSAISRTRKLTARLGTLTSIQNLFLFLSSCWIWFSWHSQSHRRVFSSSTGRIAMLRAMLMFPNSSEEILPNRKLWSELSELLSAFLCSVTRSETQTVCPMTVTMEKTCKYWIKPFSRWHMSSPCMCFTKPGITRSVCVCVCEREYKCVWRALLTLY